MRSCTAAAARRAGPPKRLFEVFFDAWATPGANRAPASPTTDFAIRVDASTGAAIRTRGTRRAWSRGRPGARPLRGEIRWFRCHPPAVPAAAAHRPASVRGPGRPAAQPAAAESEIVCISDLLSRGDPGASRAPHDWARASGRSSNKPQSPPAAQWGSRLKWARAAARSGGSSRMHVPTVQARAVLLQDASGGVAVRSCTAASSRRAGSPKRPFEVFFDARATPGANRAPASLTTYIALRVDASSGNAVRCRGARWSRSQC